MTRNQAEHEDRGIELELHLDRRVLKGRSLVSVVLERSLPGSPLVGAELLLAVDDCSPQAPIWRCYSIRQLEPEAGSLELWIDTTSRGPGARWALEAPMGSRVRARLSSSSMLLDEMADWHLFVGDLSFMAASYAIAEAIDPPGQAIFLFEIADPADALLPSLDEGIGVTAAFIERAGRPLGDPAGLAACLDALALPSGEGHAYLGGERGVVRSLERKLCTLGLPQVAIEAGPNWRLGHSAG
jgi:NADPH-dependent ferric siderophore reductase